MPKPPPETSPTPHTLSDSKDSLDLRTVALACGFIVLLDLALYWNSLGLYFIQDDFTYLWLTGDQSIRGFLTLFATQTNFYRPISSLVYFFFLQLMFGTNPLPYHAANLLIHVVNSLAVGYLGYRLTGNRAIAFISSLIYTSRVGHVIAVYWVCVTTQSMTLMFFLLSMIFYLHYRANGRFGLLLVSYLLFGLCALSNINGPPLALIITVYDLLWREGRSLSSIAKSESGFYLIVLSFLVLQFLVFGYAEYEEYRATLGMGSLKNFGTLNVFAYNPLFLLSYYTGFSPEMLIPGIMAGIATVAAALLLFRAEKRWPRLTEPRLALFFGFWYLWGLAPYLPLTEHLWLDTFIWPQYITTAAVGLSCLLALLLSRCLGAKAITAALCVILIVSFCSVRLFEKVEYETGGTIYKSELARNVISDLKENLKDMPEADKVIILDSRVEIWWILHYGRNAKPFVDKMRPIFHYSTAEAIPTEPGALVLRYDNMRLHRIR